MTRAVVDSHCHLADPAFEADLERVVERARAAGVERVLCVLAAGDAPEAARAERLIELWPDVRLAIGVHPHVAHTFAGRVGDATAAVRAQIAATPAARALGEIGLDYHYDFSPHDVQREIFRCQVQVARELDLPVVIHTREAEDDTLAILEEEGGSGRLRGVFHCFTGDRETARRVLDFGFHVSFAGIITFPRAGALRAAARLVPSDRLLVETDAPYLAPVPFRGRRNEPAWVTSVVRALADVRGEPADRLARQTTDAFLALLDP